MTTAIHSALLPRTGDPIVGLFLLLYPTKRYHLYRRAGEGRCDSCRRSL